MFYESQLIATVSDVESKEIRLLKSLKDCGILPPIKSNPNSAGHGVCFWSVYGENTRIHPNKSWCNVDEANQVRPFVLLIIFFTTGGAFQ